MQTPFSFKQFSICQDKCAMKIGTDSVILGAWAHLENHPDSILDIGSGTGILGLMLAQRCNASLIDAIEIDADAYEQCVNNFEQSPWADRLFCYHASLNEFVTEMDQQYDVIICNPPFYTENYKTANKQRDLARFTDAMPFNHLLLGVSKLLNPNGLFSVVIPYKEETAFLTLAKQFKLFPKHILHVKGNPTSNKKRSLITFSFYNETYTTKTLIVENSRHNYTTDYINLTKDFYLKL